MSRNIIVASSAANRAKKITDFTGSTVKEFKEHPVVAELWVGNVEAILNPGNVTLREDSTLPTGDFKVYLVPTKNKAGMTEEEAKQIGKEIAEAIVKGAKLADADEVTELKRILKGEIEDFFNVVLDDEECPECDEALAEARAFRS